MCRWKGGGRLRWRNVEAELTSSVVRSVQKCAFVWGTNKGKRTKIHLSFIYKIAISIAVHYSLPSCLIRFPYGHAYIPFSSRRCLCITHSARHLQYEPAFVVCYFTDDSWRKCRLLDHGYNGYNTVAMTCARDSELAPDRRSRKGRKGSNIVGPYIPYDLLQTKGETCAKFGWDRFRNVDLYKVQKKIETNKQKRTKKNISSLYIRYKTLHYQNAL